VELHVRYEGDDDPEKCTARRLDSLGLATLQRAGVATAEQLVACADQALYRAKSAGRDQLRIHGRRADHGSDSTTPSPINSPDTKPELPEP